MMSLSGLDSLLRAWRSNLPSQAKDSAERGRQRPDRHPGLSTQLLSALRTGTAILSLVSTAHARSLSPDDISVLASNAERGDDASQVLLGIAYMNGDGGLGKDLPQAARWFEQAALLGNPYAQERIADLYDTGKGVPVNSALAFEWRLQAAQRGNLNAQFKLARMYLSGVGIKRNVEAGTDWLKRAAVEGSTDAQLLLEQMEFERTARPVQPQQTRTWLELAANQGYERGVELLQLIERIRFGFEEDWHHRPPDMAELASNGDLEAQYQLAQAYEHGIGGMTTDLPAAVHWYSMAGENGHQPSMRALSRILDSGIGVPRDANAAKRWAERAAGPIPLRAGR